MQPTYRVNASRRIVLIAAAAWLLAVGSGFARLWSYSLAPGVAADAPPIWPPDSPIPRQTGVPLLVMIAHPECPCTRASIGELSRLVADSPVALSVAVVFVMPRDRVAAWQASDLWRSAVAIPSVSAFADADGREARRFGSATSGQTFLYDGRGRLRFSGGITAARGHAGDNAGRHAILAILDRTATDEARTPVFGCPLFTPRDKCAHGGPLCT